MMLLIENRPIRQQLFEQKTGIYLDSYSDILDNQVGEDELHIQLIDEIKKNTFDFTKYSVIAFHQTAFGDDNTIILNKLDEYCHTHNIPLVLFTGSIDIPYYDNSEYEKLEINSKIFYSNRLQIFLDAMKKGDENILIFAYGEKWKANIFLNIIEKINLFLENNAEEKISFKRFARDTGLSHLNNMDLSIYTPHVEGRYIHADEIKKVASDLEEHIKKVAINE